MYLLDEKSTIKLHTDTSDYGIGGVLIQVVRNEWRPIAFISKSLSATQLKWSMTQKESYAIYYSCQQLDSIIRDRELKVQIYIQI